MKFQAERARAARRGGRAGGRGGTREDPAGFSPSYAEARRRFLRAAEAAGAALGRDRIEARGPDGEELAIDFARLGPADPARALVVSSGIHGVEGFHGSAIQSRWLEARAASPDGADADLPRDLAVIFIHAVNPYGFAWLRRANEDNIDVNRNCLAEDERYEGAPPGYERIAVLLNPARPPGPKERLPLGRLGLKIARHGFSTLVRALVTGQYEYPDHLFYGGRGPSASREILARRLPEFLGPAERVVHLDFHSGLGKRGEFVLLLEPSYAPETLDHLVSFFPGCPLEGASGDDYHAAYALRGGVLSWCTSLFADRDYRPITAEFGTQPNMRVLEALYLENLAHRYGEAGSPAYERAKDRMARAFAPPDPRWRRKVSDKGVWLVERALAMAADRDG